MISADQKIIQFRHDSPLYQKAVELRYRVLRAPLGLQFTQAELERDSQAVHFGITEGKELVGVLSLHSGPNSTVRMKQVAVASSHQGTGYGSSLVEAAEKWAKEMKFERIQLHARETALGFYLRHQYNIVGTSFIEVGIVHFLMEKFIK